MRRRFVLLLVCLPIGFLSATVRAQHRQGFLVQKLGSHSRIVSVSFELPRIKPPTPVRDALAYTASGLMAAKCVDGLLRQAGAALIFAGVYALTTKWLSRPTVPVWSQDGSQANLRFNRLFQPFLLHAAIKLFEQGSRLHPATRIFFHLDSRGTIVGMRASFFPVENQWLPGDIPGISTPLPTTQTFNLKATEFDSLRDLVLPDVQESQFEDLE